MKVVAFNGSPRKKGNTYIALEKVLEKISEQGITTEIIQLGGKKLHGCIACFKCMEKKDGKCHGPNDDMNEIIEAMTQADGFIIGSPTYFSAISTEVKAVMDRCGLVGKANGHLYKRKVGAAVVAVRRAGATDVFDQINKFFLINMMIVPGSSYWNMVIGQMPGDALNDAEGMETMAALGENFAWLLKKTAC